jgi:hypothetical protein
VTHCSISLLATPADRTLTRATRSITRRRRDPCDTESVSHLNGALIAEAPLRTRIAELPRPSLAVGASSSSTT